MQTQRMILWIVFSMSLLFLWDSWQRHQGHASLFGGSPPAEQGVHEGPGGRAGTGPSAAKGGAASDAAIPPPTAAPSGAPVTGAAAPAPATSGAAVASDQTVRLTNDVLSIDIDLMGGQVRRAELLGHREENGEEAQNLVLLQYAPGRIYLAQSGLIGDTAAGTTFPTHRTPMTPVGGDASPRTLGAGNDVQLKLEAESGGVRLVRTYTLARGEYVVRVKDEVTNLSDAPLSPVLYLQLTRDGDAPPGGSKFYSTYTGPVVYTNEDKFQKVSFSDIEKGKANYAKAAADGWVGIIQHYFVAAWVPQQGVQRDYYARKVDNNLYSVGIKEPLGTLAPNATTSAESQLLVGPQKQDMLQAIAPGLDLTVDYGWLTVIAKPIYWLLEKLHAVVGNWGWAIVLLTLLIKTIFFPLQAASYILPLVMAGTMFIQVKLNPTPPDPIQAKMMMIMPLVFSVMFFFFPAGLVLYWLVNNVYSIAQQWVINKKLGVLHK